MDPVRTALLAAALPAGVAAVALLLLRFGSKRCAFLEDPAAAVAIAAGFVAGTAGLEGAPTTAAVEPWQWLPWIAIVAAGAALWQGPGRFGPWARLVVLAPAVAYVSVLTRNAAWVGGVGAAVLVAAAVLDLAARRAAAAEFLIAAAVLATATSVTLFLSGTMRIAALCGALAAASGACAVVGRRIPSPPRSAALLVALLLAAFSLNGVLLAEMPLTSAVLLAAAPLGACLPDAALRRLRRPWQRFAVRTGTVALVSGAAVAVAFANSPPLDY